jgi:phosphatidate cytidylyltransferase
MLKRTLTALLLIPPVVYVIGWSPKWLFVLATVVAVVLALREYFALCRAMSFEIFPWVGYPGAAVLSLVHLLPKEQSHYVAELLVLVILLLLVPTLGLWRSTNFKEYLVATSVTIFGIFYIGFAFSCLVALRLSPLSFEAPQGGQGIQQPLGASRPLLLLFLVIWAGDICAYLVGRSIGRIPFFARISPRKTWEGALAGLAGSLLASWAFAHWFWKLADVKTIVLLAAWVAVAGQFGDLVESAIKRGANQKDSGTLLPGHGGFLDRIDSLLFAAPAMWLAMFVLGSWL